MLPPLLFPPIVHPHSPDHFAGMVATPHVLVALEERIWGFPVMAPYFHYAFGFGIAMALQLLVPAIRGKQGAARQTAYPPVTSSSVAGILMSVLFGPTLGLLWDPVERIVSLAVGGASKFATVPLIMVSAFILPLILGDGIYDPVYVHTCISTYRHECMHE